MVNKTTKENTTGTPIYYYALGRRKTATATVRIFAEPGDSVINEKKVDEVYPHQHEQLKLELPFTTAELDPKQYHFTVKVKGSGQKAQLDAIQHAISRAIVVMDPTLKPSLKKEGLLTRDPRMVERKKPGLRKARRAEQFSKR